MVVVDVVGAFLFWFLGGWVWILAIMRFVSITFPHA